MSSLFHPSLFSSRLSKSLGLPSPSVSRTAPADTGFRQDKEKGTGKDIRMSFGLLADVAFFYFILAADAALTAEIFLRARLGIGTKESFPAG